MIVSTQLKIYNSIIESVYATIYALQSDGKAMDISSISSHFHQTLFHQSSSSTIPYRSATAITSVKYPIKAFSTKLPQQFELNQPSSSWTTSVGSPSSYLTNQPSGSCNPDFKILAELFPPEVHTPSTSKMAQKQSKICQKTVTTKNETKKRIWSEGLEVCVKYLTFLNFLFKNINYVKSLL